MSQYFHVVPWFDTAEWRQVYIKIYSPSNSLTDKEEALNTLLIWKARCVSLPSGVESTLTLLHVYIQDINNDNELNDHMIRLAYSTALMRFVNHMLDEKKSNHSSFYKAAKNLGIPDWIVDMRHDTAHSNNLPTIYLLREATIISLEWLKSNYWERQDKCIYDYISGQKVTVDNQDDDKIAALMRFCVSLSICGHSKCGIKNLSAIPNAHLRESIVNDARDLFGDCYDFSNLKTVSLQSVINMMKTQSKKMLKSKDVSEIVNKALLGEESIFLSHDVFCELCPENLRKKNQLSKHYVQCFELLLTFLHTSDLLLNFILELIKITETEEHDHNKRLLAALWVSEIMKSLMRCKIFHERNKTDFSQIKSRQQKDLTSLFYHWFPNERGSLLYDLQKRIPSELTDITYIQPILSTYNPYLTYFMRDMLNLVHPPLPKQMKEKICKLGKLISSPDQFPAVSSDILYTVEDLEKHSDGSEKENEDSGNDSDCLMLEEQENMDVVENTSRWQLSTHTNWSTCPFGLVPWQNVTKTN